MKVDSITFENLLRFYRFYEALALYDAYYERAADLNEKYGDLGDALDMAWVPLVFHCSYFKNLESIFRDGMLLPAKNKDGTRKTYISLTELPITELTRFRSLRPEPFEVAIGFPRALLEKRGLFQPAYLKHATEDVKSKFTDAPPGYVELKDDLGAFHEVRIPDSLRLDDAVWVLSSRRNEVTRKLDLPELKPIRERGLAISFWHPSHQKEMIREPVFRKVTSDSIECHGKHYLPGTEALFEEKEIKPPAGKPFKLKFPKELRSDTLKEGWEGPFSKYEMAAFFFEELQQRFPNRIAEVQPRIEM